MIDFSCTVMFRFVMEYKYQGFFYSILGRSFTFSFLGSLSVIRKSALVRVLCYTGTFLECIVWWNKRKVSKSICFVVFCRSWSVSCTLISKRFWSVFTYFFRDKSHETLRISVCMNGTSKALNRDLVIRTKKYQLFVVINSHYHST